MIFTFWTAPMSVSEPEARRRQAYACRDALKKKIPAQKKCREIFPEVKNFAVFLFFVFVFKFFHEHRREDAEHTQENQNPTDRR